MQQRLKPILGINGGTFDPIHHGHLRSALDVMTLLNLDKVHFVPCFKPVHRGKPGVSAQQRSEMVALAVQSVDEFVLDTTEVDEGGASYMVKTLRELTKKHPNHSLLLMMGTDAFKQFHTWFAWQDILKLANVAVMKRAGDCLILKDEIKTLFQRYCVTRLTKDAGQIIDVPITQLEISSTRIRQEIGEGKRIAFLVPNAVEEYICQHWLYQRPVKA